MRDNNGDILGFLGSFAEGFILGYGATKLVQMAQDASAQRRAQQQQPQQQSQLHNNHNRKNRNCGYLLQVVDCLKCFPQIVLPQEL